MARLSRLQFLGVAVTFHLLYFCPIFDVYLLSPVVKGMEAHHVQISGPPPVRPYEYYNSTPVKCHTPV